MGTRKPEKTRSAAAVAWWVAAGIVAVVLLVPLFALVAAIAILVVMQYQHRLRDRLRVFNRRWLNPAILAFAGRRGRPYTVVHHIGRRSGRVYATPVVAEPTADGFVIPLPYGAETDWCRNVLAAGACTLERDGVTYRVGEPVVLAATAPPVLLTRRGRAWRAFRIGQFLRVKRLAVVPVAPEPVTA